MVWIINMKFQKLVLLFLVALLVACDSPQVPNDPLKKIKDQNMIEKRERKS